MKKTNLVLGGLAIAVLGSTAALAASPRSRQGIHKGPGMPPPPSRMQRWEDDRRVPEKAPEEIKNAFKEMKSLERDLHLELGKDNPDSAKALEMLKKSEELRAKVREWEVKQILEGNAPKPDGRQRRGGPEAHGSEGRLAPGFGSYCPVPMAPHYMAPIMPYYMAPVYHCPCMTVPLVPPQGAPAPAVPETPAAETPAAK